MKRLMLLGLVVLMISTSFILTTGTASAKTTTHMRAAAYATAYCGWSCDGENPIFMGCTTGSVGTYYINTAVAVPAVSIYPEYDETIEIRYSYVCHAAWALVIFNRPLPSGYLGNAIITRNSDNQQVDCTVPGRGLGGNGIVTSGQTSCYSGMLDDGPTTSTWAAGMFDIVGFGSGWNQVVASSGSF